MKILLSFLLLSLSFVINANNQYVDSNKKQEVQQAVYKIIYKVNQFSGTKMPKQLVYKFINNEIFSLFDFDYMSQEILKGTTINLKNKNVIQRVKADIFNTITQTLLKARGRFFVPIGVRIMGKNIILTTRVKNINIDLIMHNTIKGWKIFDIALKNQSLIDYYKQLLHR